MNQIYGDNEVTMGSLTDGTRVERADCHFEQVMQGVLVNRKLLTLRLIQLFSS